MSLREIILDAGADMQYISTDLEGIQLMNKIADDGVRKITDACIQAITDNPHKNPIEAITDMRRKDNDI